eukprot:TRINITY_DN90990_c0_g1_i1.p1 TRINITY_DN90990_c0_g1~~TRINITY_DN90990_c0_g1_i1.p1  ORF type:complete len:808 (-),score=133.07 TRINITY_DN90990_c0_g1_i1:7-2430(-)
MGIRQGRSSEKTPFAASHATQLAAFLLLSTLVPICNKQASRHFAYLGAGFQSGAQCVLAVTCLLVAGALGLVQLDELSRQTLKSFWPYACAFGVSMLATNRALGLAGCTLEALFVSWACEPLLVALYRKLGHGESPSPRSAVAALGVAASASAFFHLRSSPEAEIGGSAGNLWLAVGLGALAYERAYGKRVLHTMVFKTPVWTSALLCHAISLGSCVLFSIGESVVGDKMSIAASDARGVTVEGVLWLLASSVLGPGLSYVAYSCHGASRCTFHIALLISRFASLCLDAALQGASSESWAGLALMTCCVVSSVFCDEKMAGPQRSLPRPVPGEPEEEPSSLAPHAWPRRALAVAAVLCGLPVLLGTRMTTSPLASVGSALARQSVTASPPINSAAVAGGITAAVHTVPESDTDSQSEVSLPTQQQSAPPPLVAELRPGARLNATAVIVGMMKNSANFISRAIHIMEAMGGLFAAYDIVIIENDSKDDTSQQLRAWARRNPNVLVSTHIFGRTKRDIYSRTRWLSQLRNRQLEIAFQFSWASNIRHEWKPDVVIVFDPDMKAVDLDGLASSVRMVLAPGGPVGATANGVTREGRYYDMFAFRSCNVHWDARKGPLFDLKEKDEWERLMPLYTSDLEPFAVDSAFSGCAVYKAEAVFGRTPQDLPATWHSSKSAEAACTASHPPQDRYPVHSVYQAAADVGREGQLPCLYGDGGLNDCEHIPFHACLNGRAAAWGLKSLHVVPRFGVQYEDGKWRKLKKTEWILKKSTDANFDPLVVNMPASTSRTEVPSHWKTPANPVKCACEMWTKC